MSGKGGQISSDYNTDPMNKRLNIFRYTWFDLKPDHNEVMDLLGKLENKNFPSWPPKEELESYIRSADLEDKDDLLELFVCL